MSERPRLVFVVPELPPVSENQYAHHFSLLTRLAELATITAVVERGPAVQVPGVTVICQRRSNPVLRAAELAGLLIRLRRDGYRHAYGYYSPYYGVVGGLIARLIGIRTAYWHCRVDFFNAAISKPWRLRDLILHTIPLALSLHLCRRLVTGTDRLADGYARTFRIASDKIAVVPNDIDLARWPRRGARDSSTALFVGRLTEHKGAHLLPAFWRRLSESEPEARLVIAGSGQLESRLRTELASDIASGRVSMTGAISNAQASELMGASTVLLLPSLSEGFPRVVLEAMAAGIPLVATDVGGIAEVVPDGVSKNLVTPGSAVAMADAVARLLREPSLRSALADEGLAHVQRFDVSRVAPELLAAVTATAADEPRPLL